jgi:uncharacterized protein YheU (UPF0270 family)
MPGAIKQGSEFRINTTTAGTQHEPAIRSLPDGRLVVVWSDTSNGTDVEVRARVVTADGLEAVPEFVVTSTTADHQYEPELTVLADGSFVVVWSDTGNGTDVDVRARVFHDDGSEAVGEFVVSAAVAGDQFEPTVATLADGRFVVAWADNSGATCDIRARIFNADGTESVAEFVANGTAANSQYLPVVIALADGRFVVSWTDDSRSGGDTSELAIRAAVYNADGSQAVPEFLVNTTAAGSQLESSAIELADGRVVIAWSDFSGNAPDPSNGAVRARIFNADFTPVANDFVVNTTVPSYQARPAMTALADGGFVVAWEDLSGSGGDASSLAVRAQLFSAAATRAGGEFLVNTATSSAQFDPAIAALGDGRIVVTWTDFSQTGGDTSSSAIRAQTFDLTEHPPAITSNGAGNAATMTLAENATAVTTVTATDPNGDVATYSIVGGADVALFRINAATGALSFIAAPDFEAPGDAGSDNSYVVQVRASAGGLFDEQTITINIADEDESLPSVGDVLWRHSDGTVATANHVLGTVPTNWQIATTGDFDADGDADILWRHRDGLVVTWEMENGQYLTNHNIAFASVGWEIVDAGDFDGDGDADVLWRHRDGAVVTWEMEDGEYVQNHNVAFASIGWEIDGLGDFDGDGDSDIIWRHRDGAVVTWEMEDSAIVTNHNIAFASIAWQIQGTGDFDGDGDDDILWRHAEGAAVTWELEDGGYVANHGLGSMPTTWQIRGTADFDSDGDSDILWRNHDGAVTTWDMQNGAFLQSRDFGIVSNAWQIVRTGEFDLT